MEYVRMIISGLIGFLFGVLSMFVADRWTFLKKKQLLNTIRKEAPMVCLSQGNSESTKLLITGSIFYKVTLQVSSDEEMKEIPKLDIKKLASQDVINSNYDLNSKFLITVTNQSWLCELRKLTYERYNAVSLGTPNGFVLSGQQRLTFIFDIKDRPNQLIAKLDDAILTYNLDAKGGSSIKPKIKT